MVSSFRDVDGGQPEGGVVVELRYLVYMLWTKLCVDLLNITHLLSGEHLARRILQIQKAIRRSPKHPDFTGLDQLMASQLDETGGVVTAKFDEWVAQEQKTQAIIMKNTRLLQ